MLPLFPVSFQADDLHILLTGMVLNSASTRGRRSLPDPAFAVVRRPIFVQMFCRTGTLLPPVLCCIFWPVLIYWLHCSAPPPHCFSWYCSVCSASVRFQETNRCIQVMAADSNVSIRILKLVFRRVEEQNDDDFLQFSSVASHDVTATS